MNIVNRISFLVIVVATLYCCTASERPTKIERPQEPKDIPERGALAKNARNLEIDKQNKEKLLKDERDPKKKQELENELKTVENQKEYVSSLIRSFDAQEDLRKNPKDLAAQLKEENVTKDEAIARVKLDNDLKKLAEKSQEHYTPASPSEKEGANNGPGIIDTIRLNLDKIITNFQLDRALSSKDIVRSGELRSKLSKIYEELGKKDIGTQELNKKFISTDLLDHLKLYEQALKDPKNKNAQEESTRYIQEYLSSFVQEDILFALGNKNQNAVAAHTEEINKILDSFGIDEQQKAKIKKLVTNAKATIEGRTANTVTDFFDNQSKDPSSNVKNFKERLKKINDILQKQGTTPTNLRFTDELKKEFAQVESLLNEYNDYATYFLHGIDPLYRTKLLSFVETGYFELEQFYKRFLPRKKWQLTEITNDPALHNQYHELSAKRKKAFENYTTATKKLVAELEKNKQKFQKTSSYKSETLQETNAKPISKDAESAAEYFGKMAQYWIEQMNNITEVKPEKGFSQNEITHFNKELLESLDTFINSALNADASEKAVVYAQTLLDEILRLQNWIKEYSRVTGIDPSQRKKLVDALNQLEQKAAAIRKIWIRDIHYTLREGPTGELYILPQSKGPKSLSGVLAKETLQEVVTPVSLIPDLSETSESFEHERIDMTKPNEELDPGIV